MTSTFAGTDRAIDGRSADIIFRDAHTAYSFTGEPVLDDQLAAIYDHVKHAPTAMNTQPLRITYVRSPEAKARLLPHAPAAKDMFADPAARTKAATFNATLQAGYFILAVRAVGLDAGPMGGIDAIGIDREFFAGTGLRTFLAVNIGYVAEDGTFPRNPRFEAHEVVTVL